MDTITLAHGSGGRLSRELIEEIIYPIFNNNNGHELYDSALLPFEKGTVAMTTDSFVISPIFFPGGNIGKLAACGTINDLAAAGAIPKYMSVGLIIEEGFLIKDLQEILISLYETAAEADVCVVTGDTKIVERGSADRIYINTSGIGIVPEGVSVSPKDINVDDLVIVNGTIGDHGMAILSCREGLSFGVNLKSDCAPLNGLVKELLDVGGVSCMRDPTRGGLAGILLELAHQSGTQMEICEKAIPLHPSVRAGCDMLGLDPLYLANEGKLAIIANPSKKEEIMRVLQSHPLGKNAQVIGRVASRDLKGTVLMETDLGVKRPLMLLEGEDLPRIC